MGEHVANVWQTEPPGRCFRWVGGVDGGGPSRCDGTVVRSGWWRDGGRRWRQVEACQVHADEVRERPGR